MFDRVQWVDPYSVESPYEGIERRVLSFTEELMLVHYTVVEDAVFPVHDHEETQQAVYVLSGSVELLGDESGTLAAGDSFVVGPGVEHGIRGASPRSELVDAFSPPIEEYRP